MSFEEIISQIIEHEGGSRVSNHAADAGGVTKFGCSQRFLDSISYPTAAPDLELDQAIAIYLEHFWLPSRAKELKPDLQHGYLDHCVLAGQRNSVRVLQKACNSRNLVGANGNRLDEDGLIGTNTISATNGLQPGWLRWHRWLYFEDLIERKPSQEAFRKGWMRRVFEV